MTRISIDQGAAYEYPKIVFEIGLRIGVAYMRVDRTNFLNDERAVIIVDREKFLDLWRAHPDARASEGHDRFSYGDAETWMQDYNYPNAVEGFALGRDNPVPLAEVNLKSKQEPVEYLLKTKPWQRKVVVRDSQQRGYYVGFTNGVTRTLWLLANGATTFPVTCGLGEASRLYKLARAEGTHFHTVASLTQEHSYIFKQDFAT